MGFLSKIAGIAAPFIPGIGGAIAGGLGALGDNKAGAAAAQAARPDFNPLLKPEISKLLGSTSGTTAATFGGDRVADLTTNQQAGLALTPGIAQGQQGQQATVGQGFNDFASGSLVGNNPFLDQQIQGLQQSTNQNLSRNVLPSIRNNAVASGGIGGSRQGIAEGLAISDSNQSLINAESDLRFNQLNSDLSNQLSALTNQGAILGGQNNAQNTLLNAGSIQQGQNQAEIGGEQAKFADDQNLQFDRDKGLLSLLLGSGQNAAPVANVTNPLVAAAGGALVGQQLFGNQQPSTQFAPIRPAPPLGRGVSPTQGAIAGTPF